MLKIASPKRRKDRDVFVLVLLVLTGIVAAIGIADTVVLYHIHKANERGVSTGFCTDGSGCDLVDRSPYSELWGVPLSVFGFLFYLMVLGTVLCWRMLRTYAPRLLLLQSIVGLAVSAYLWYLMRFIIGAYCKYCLISDGLSITIFILAAVLYRHDLKKGKQAVS